MRPGVLQKGNDRLRPFFLDIFGGTEGVSRAIRRRGFACKSFDIAQGAGGDLSRPVVVKRICRLLRSQQCRGMVLAPPCTTFSIARRPALRSMAQPWGKDNLSEKEQAQLHAANVLIRNTLTIIRVATACKVPWALENPRSSLLWQVPEMCSIARQSASSYTDLHMCGFGSRWRKATRLLSSRIAKMDEMIRKCCPSAAGVCSFSKQPHIRLQGRDPHGVSWTRRAQEYPALFCARLSELLINAGREREFATIAIERSDTFVVLKW